MSPVKTDKDGQFQVTGLAFWLILFFWTAFWFLLGIVVGG